MFYPTNQEIEMRPVNVKNAYGDTEVQVRSSTIDGNISLAVEDRNFSFWHMMTTDQARQMAAALISFADIQDAKIAKGE